MLTSYPIQSSGFITRCIRSELVYVVSEFQKVCELWFMLDKLSLRLDSFMANFWQVWRRVEQTSPALHNLSADSENREML